MKNQELTATQDEAKRGVKGGCGAGWGCECEQCETLRAANRELVAARLMTNGQHVRSLLGTFDGYVYARGSNFILRREVNDTFWSCFCGIDLWPVDAVPREVIAQQLGAETWQHSRSLKKPFDPEG